ncbi:SDR family oxidoreductase [Rhizobium sp. WL3]|uniref:SDR family oxidoreductase n=1 Tax=Rhizobium sp. WL3 TaxID=2603277 RepID=UPI0011C1EBA7|nr:SDR family oxidoreductase [Rhizobium sp. WL3]QEE44192.1 SDR family oxidoreductase [Rhizobium sp. WL3]
MPILVLGATGFIGQQVALSLQAAGHSVVGLGRDIRQASARFPDIGWITRDLRALRQASDWLPLLEGVTVVVNCAGALQDGLRDDLVAVQRDAMLALQDAARTRLPTPLIVQISAPENLGRAGTAFMATKLDADRALASSGLPHVILRPTVVVGRNAYGGTALLRAIASFPGLLPLVDAASPMNAVHVHDVAQAVVDAVQGRISPGSDLVLAGEPTRTVEEMARFYRRWLGLADAPVLRLPSSIASTLSYVADLAGRLGWRSPLRSTAIRISGIGVSLEPGRPTLAAPDPALRLITEPAAVQDLWFARLYLLKPLMILTLSLFWIFSGLVPLLDPVTTSLRFGASMPAAVALPVTILTSLLDITLGLAIIVQPWAKKAMLGMIAVSLAYLAGGTVIEPTLWLDPLGPLVKVLPSILLTLVILAVLEER